MKSAIYNLGAAGRFRIATHELGAIFGVELQVPGALWTWATIRIFQEETACRGLLFEYAIRTSKRAIANELKIEEEEFFGTSQVELGIPAGLSMLPCNGCARFDNGSCSAKLARPKRRVCKMRKEKYV